MGWWKSSNWSPSTPTGGGPWDRLRQLRWSERGLLAQALVLLPLTALALRLLGFQRWQSAMGRLSRRQQREPADGDERWALSVARLVRAAANHGIHRATCLEQSCTVWWLLRRQGIDSNLRIGVRKEGGALRAHAWVEYRGRVLTNSAEAAECFVPLRGSWPASPEIQLPAEFTV